MRWRPPEYPHDRLRLQYPPFCFAPFSSMVYCRILCLLAAGEGYPDHQTPAVRGLEELFSAVLEKFLKPINAPRVYGT